MPDYRNNNGRSQGSRRDAQGRSYNNPWSGFDPTKDRVRRSETEHTWASSSGFGQSEPAMRDAARTEWSQPVQNDQGRRGSWPEDGQGQGAASRSYRGYDQDPARGTAGDSRRPSREAYRGRDYRDSRTDAGYRRAEYASEVTPVVDQEAGEGHVDERPVRESRSYRDRKRRTESRTSVSRDDGTGYRSRARADLNPAPDFHDSPAWARIPGGRKNHDVSFKGSSRSYYDSGRGPLKQGNVRVSLQSMGVPTGRGGNGGGGIGGAINSVASALPLPLNNGLVPIVACVIAFLLVVFGISSCVNNQRIAEEEAAAAAAAAELDARTVSFLAVGDNLPDATIGKWADAQSGKSGDGTYDYTGLYKNLKSYVKDADLSYMNEESLIGGDEIGPQGYPVFNTTDEMADAIEDTGFDLVGGAGNHTYDYGLSALKHCASVLNAKDFTMVGINESEDKAVAYKTVEKKGITFAFLDYTYGLNDVDSDEVPSWSINIFSKDRLKKDVKAAKKEADVVIVAMHWGTEKQTTPDSTEKEYAQYLADLGVDLIVGSHPHVIQPMEWIEGKDGNKTLCCYSLGNFCSNHDNSNYLPELEGMVTCDFVRDADSNEVSIENVVFVPLVNHRVLADEAADCEFGVYALKDYTDELAKKHYDFTDLDDPIGWLKGQVDEIMGDDFTIDYGQASEEGSEQAA